MLKPATALTENGFKPGKFMSFHSIKSRYMELNDIFNVPIDFLSLLSLQ